MKALLIDDSDDIRKVLRKIISGIGAEIAGEASNYTDGLELAKKSDAHVIILDIKLGNKSGFDILKKVKSKKKTPIIIIFSNYSAKQYREKAFKEKADYFFNKTDESSELIDLLNLLNNRFN
jgi:DNA-binding NarL/FixJ family response regulator